MGCRELECSCVTGDGTPLFSCFEEVGQFLRKLVFISHFHQSHSYIYPREAKQYGFVGVFLLLFMEWLRDFNQITLSAQTWKYHELGTVLKHTYSFGDSKMPFHFAFLPLTAVKERASLVAQIVKNMPAMQETQVNLVYCPNCTNNFIDL